MSLTSRWDIAITSGLDKMKGYANVEMVNEETENEKCTSEKNKHLIPLKSSEIRDIPCKLT